MLKITFRIAGGLLLVLIIGLGLGYLRVGMRGVPLVSADPSIPLAEVDCGQGLRGGRCGVVKAPLDYDAPSGEQIDIFFAYFPVRGVRPDRLLSLQLIGGGPGQPLFQSLRDVPMWIFQLRALDHGMLIIEPRGLAPSADLTCPAVQDTPGKRTQEFGQTPNASVEKCAAEIGPRRIHCNTPNTARDFDRVRRALAIGRLDIAGFSYGTLLAAVYAGMFPKAVRTLAFNGSLPVAGWSFLNPDQHAAARRRFEQVCARSRQCAGEEAWSALGTVADSLRRAPRRVRAADGSGAEVIVTPAVLAGMIVPAPRPRSDDDPTLVDPIIGALLDGARGNWSALELLAARYFVTGTFERPNDEASAGPVFNQAVWLAVQCSEFAGMPWSPSDDIATRQAKFDAALQTVAPGRFAPFSVAEWAGRKNDMNYYDQCMHWPPSPGEPVRRPLTSYSDWAPDLPVLLLNGDYDMQTTHELARGAAEQFASRPTWYARFENFGHVIMPRSACARGLWFELVRTRRVADPDVCHDDGGKMIVTRP